ncbi:hypothetical protein Tco_0574409 [Tanacetum coccineum]
MPSLPSPEPTVSCFDDLYFFKDFENEFSAIVYNNAPTSKSDLLTEPTLSPQHIDEFDLKDETSLSEYDEVEQNVLYFNDLFPFNIIQPDDLKMLFYLIMNLYVSFGILFDPKLYYKDGVYTRMLRRPRYGSSSTRLEALGMPKLMRDALYDRMMMEHRDDGKAVVFTSQAWRRLFDTRGPLFQLGGARRWMSWRKFIAALGLHTGDEMESPGFARYWSESERMIPGKGNLRDYWRDIFTNGDFL